MLQGARLSPPRTYSHCQCGFAARVMDSLRFEEVFRAARRSTSRNHMKIVDSRSRVAMEGNWLGHKGPLHRDLTGKTHHKGSWMYSLQRCWSARFGTHRTGAEILTGSIRNFLGQRWLSKRSKFDSQYEFIRSSHLLASFVHHEKIHDLMLQRDPAVVSSTGLRCQCSCQRHSCLESDTHNLRECRSCYYSSYFDRLLAIVFLFELKVQMHSSILILYYN